jgi:serine/threonine protein kinase
MSTDILNEDLITVRELSDNVSLVLYNTKPDYDKHYVCKTKSGKRLTILAEGETLNYLNSHLVENPYCEIPEVIYLSSERIILSYIPGKTLFDYMTDNHPIPIENVRTIFYNLVSAFKMIHELGIYHRDIKPENLIIISNSLKIGIIDWEFAVRFTTKQHNLDPAGTLYYVAPEVISYDRYIGPENDIWSIGIMLYCMITKHLPYSQAICPKILSNDILNFKIQFHRCAELKFRSCLNIMEHIFKPYKERATLDEILSHPWFTNVDGINNTEETDNDNGDIEGTS